MMKTTQFLANVKLWQGLFFSFLLLVSLNLNSQNVGDDLLANSNGMVDTSSGATGSGAGCFSWGGGTYDGTTQCGWTAGAGLNYAPSNNSHGPTHSGDRMFKTYKTNGSNGEFIAQEVGELALGTYTYSFFHRWTGGSIDYTEGAPKFTIKEQNADGGWDNVLEVNLVEGNTGSSGEWTETTGTWVNENVNNYKIQVYKNGAANAGLAQNLHLDSFTFVYTEAASTTTSTAIPWSDGFEVDLSNWSVVQASSGPGNFQLTSSRVNSGAQAVYHNDDSGSHDSWLVSPTFDTTTAGMPKLSFYENQNYYTYYDNHEVAYSLDYAGDATTATWTVLYSAVGTEDTWVQQTFDLPSSTAVTLAFRYQGNYADEWYIDDVEVYDGAVPSMSVTSSTDGSSATFSFAIDNFTVGASGDTGVDGHIHYSLNGGSTVMVYSSDDLTLSDLPNGDHSIVFELVDDAHASLDPAVTATVEFSTFDGMVACDDSYSHTYGNNESGTLFTSTNEGGTVTVTVTGITENNYDYLIIRDGAGNELYNASGDHTGQAITSEDGTLTVEIDSDSSVSGETLTFDVTCGTLQSNVTFSVNMSNYPGGLGADDTVYLNGNFAGWCGDCLPMSDDDGDGIWTITIPLDDGNYEYKFTVNGWSNQEQWPGDGTPVCTENADDGTYENRAFTVAGADMTLETVYWNLCIGEEPGATYTVTFEVNTSAIVGGVGANGIFAGGGVLGNAQALALSDDDGDGIWVGSIDLPEGTAGNYIFLNSPSDGGDWGAKENLEGQDCADPNNYNDRILPEVTADVTYLACFGNCSGDGTGECPSDIITYNVTFSVNTENITVGENGMFAGGGVLGGANAVALSDDDGDGVWEATVPMEENTEGNYAYFNSPNSSDDWNTKENLEGQDCADPANYNDRILAPVVEDTVLLACFGFCSGDGTGVCPAGDPALMLQGIIDFTVPSGGSDGKAIHVYVNEDIADLAQYGIGVANNGGGTDGQEYTFPTAAPTAGQHILVVRSVEAMDAYMNASAIFDHVFVDEGGSISQNGDDAIELYFLGGVVEVFGDVDVDGTGEAWEYLDSWAYKVSGEWTYGGVNCTDDSTTSCESSCPYPFADCTGDDLAGYLSAEGGWRYQYEVAGYRGVGPGDAMGADWWNASPYEDFNNATFPNDSGVNNGLVDDIMFFTTDGGFTFDTGEDATIMGKKPEVDAAFDPDGTNAYDADNDYNEYWNYPLDDFTDTYTLGNDGTYDTIGFTTVGALGFYTATGAQVYQILQQNNTTMYVRNVGSEGNSWYSMLTTDAHALSTSDNEILDMMIYPNPVDGSYVTILSPVEGIKEIQVFTVTGRKVMDTAINGNTLDVSSFNSGFYMLKVTINGQSKISKLVVR
jgi:hypothetical protein